MSHILNLLEPYNYVYYILLEAMSNAMTGKFKKTYWLGDIGPQLIFINIKE